MLTKEEREKFAAYLDSESASDLQMVEQLERIGGNDAMVKLMRTRSAASRIVAAELRRTETDSVG